METTARLEQLSTELSKKINTLAMPELQPMRQQASKQFAQHGLPDKKNEDWKYTRLTALNDIDLLASTLNAGTINLAQVPGAEIDSYRAVFIDGQFSSQHSYLDGLPSGVVICDLHTAIKQYADLVLKYLGRAVDINKPGLCALNTALMSQGYFIYLPNNIKLDQTIQTLFISTTASHNHSLHLRNICIAETNSSAIILENYQSNNHHHYFNNICTELYLAENANLEHYKLQLENHNCQHIASVLAQQERHSQLHNYSFSLGAALARNDIAAEFMAENVACDLYGLFLGHTTQHVDHHTCLNHAKPHGTSIENYRGILTDCARGVFNGRVIVAEDAQKTDAQQQNKNLLLSTKAEIDTKPQLEIFADDVKCAHGATVGQLDPDALFYLTARGIPTASAKRMLITAFAAPIIDAIKQKPIQQLVDAQVTQHLENYFLSEDV